MCLPAKQLIDHVLDSDGIKPSSLPKKLAMVSSGQIVSGPKYVNPKSLPITGPSNQILGDFSL